MSNTTAATPSNTFTCTPKSVHRMHTQDMSSQTYQWGDLVILLHSVWVVCSWQWTYTPALEGKAQQHLGRRRTGPLFACPSLGWNYYPDLRTRHMLWTRKCIQFIHTKHHWISAAGWCGETPPMIVAMNTTDECAERVAKLGVCTTLAPALPSICSQLCSSKSQLVHTTHAHASRTGRAQFEQRFCSSWHVRAAPVKVYGDILSTVAGR